VTLSSAGFASERVRITIDDSGVAFLALTRPDKHNGMDVPMLRDVVRAQRWLRRRREVRTLIVHGEGPSFCSGIDARSFMSKPLVIALGMARLYSPMRNLFQSWSMGFRELGIPVIAAIHGNCFGAGIQLALGADLRIARPDARISIMESRLGLVPDMGGPTLLRELVRLDVAKELTMTGRIVDGRAALALGLVSHVSDDPVAHAREIAGEISACSPDAVAAGKFLLQHAWAADEHTALAHERRYQRRVIGRPNQRAALATQQKRKTEATEPSALGASAAVFAPRKIET
jgi:enoyl-CoA hydratase/carnithine racemase